MEQIEAVIFDLGRVLVDVDMSRGLFQYMPSDNNRSDLEIMESLFADPVFRDFGQGKIAPYEFYQTVINRWPLNIPYQTFKREWCNVFRPMEGMEELVKQVASRYKLGMLSDIDPLHWDYLHKHYPIVRYFLKPTLSFEIGALKPDPRAYLTAAENTGAAPESCLFIDDRMINTEGAEKVGMKAIRFISVDALKQQLKERDIF